VSPAPPSPAFGPDATEKRTRRAGVMGLIVAVSVCVVPIGFEAVSGVTVSAGCCAEVTPARTSSSMSATRTAALALGMNRAVGCVTRMVPPTAYCVPAKVERTGRRPSSRAIQDTTGHPGST